MQLRLEVLIQNFIFNENSHSFNLFFLFTWHVSANTAIIRCSKIILLKLLHFTHHCNTFMIQFWTLKYNFPLCAICVLVGVFFFFCVLCISFCCVLCSYASLNWDFFPPRKWMYWMHCVYLCNTTLVQTIITPFYAYTGVEILLCSCISELHGSVGPYWRY
jgi:hypothetical protein